MTVPQVWNSQPKKAGDPFDWEMGHLKNKNAYALGFATYHNNSFISKKTIQLKYKLFCSNELQRSNLPFTIAHNMIHTAAN